MSRFCLWAGAADRDLLETRGEYYRFVNQGAFVVLVALFAGVSFTLFTSTVLPTFEPWLLLGSAFWAATVFLLDRSIVGEPSYGSHRRTATRRRWPSRRTWRAPHGDELRKEPKALPNDLPQSTGAAGPIRTATFAVRITMAVLLAWLVGEAVLLTIFHPEIRAVLDQRYEVAANVITDQASASRRGLAAELKKQQATNQATADRAAGLALPLIGRTDDEIRNGSATTRPGPGRVALEKERTAGRAVGGAVDLQKSTTETNEGLSTEIQRLDREAELIKRRDPAALAAAPDVLERLAAADNRGWIAQQSALQEYLDGPGQRGVVIVQAIPWLIRAVLLLIDLMPILLKIASSGTIYGHRQKQRADLLMHADVIETERKRASVDDRAAREARHRATNDDLDAYREQRREGTVRDYLDRNGPDLER